MFHTYSSLNNLPDISRWDMKNVTNMSYIFCGCKSINSLPDISKWNNKNAIEIHTMFFFMWFIK